MSAAQAHAFYRDVGTSGVAWFAIDERGTVVLTSRTGQRVQPFWSTRSRLERIIRAVPDYGLCQPVEVSWEAIRDVHLPKFRRAGMLVGVNWSGKSATGYDLEPDWVQHCVELIIERNGGPPATPIERIEKNGLVLGYRLVRRLAT